MLLRARLFRLIALVSACLGLLVFSYQYFTHIQGNFITAMQDAGTIGLVLFPFLPAAAFAWMTSREEKKLDKIMKELSKEAAAPAEAEAGKS